MKISVDQPIAASADEAQAAFLDPAFYHSLGELEGIAAPEVRSLSSGPDQAHGVLGYRFSGQLNGVARTILDPAKLTWAEEIEVDLATRHTVVRMVPDNYAGLLSFDGWYELRSIDDDHCCQHFEADLRVHLPLLGGVGERALAGSVRENIAETARLVERYVAGKRAAGPDGGKGAGGTPAGGKGAGGEGAGGKTGGGKGAGGSPAGGSPGDGDGAGH